MSNEKQAAYAAITEVHHALCAAEQAGDEDAIADCQADLEDAQAVYASDFGGVSYAAYEHELSGDDSEDENDQ